MHVYLLRHGDASSLAPDGSMRDDLRELTSEGVERLHVASRSYARIMTAPQRILHSPLVRARQTATILAQACNFPLALEENPLLRPGGQPAAMVDLLQGELLSGVESMVLVGHEPNLGNLLGLLVSGTEHLSLPMGKGMLAAVALMDPKVMTGELDTLLTIQAGMQLT